MDAAAWCFFLEEEEEKEKEEEDETHDYEVPIPLLFLMAGSACWLRILFFGEGPLSPSPWYGACAFIAVVTPSAPCSVVYSSSTLAVVCPTLVC